MVSDTTRAADIPPPGAQVARQHVVRLTDGTDVTVRYWLFVPAELNQKTKWPLMLFLHGAGERGEDLELVKKWGPPGFVDQKPSFPFILVSPQCPEKQFWQVESLALLVDALADELPIDKRRLYVTGLSMGGYGTWGLLAKYPRLFAAAIPICGGGDPAAAAQMKDIPIWAFHGDKDDAVPVVKSQEMVDAIQKLDGRAKLTVYEGVGHNSWSQTYDNPEIYDWLRSHERPE